MALVYSGLYQNLVQDQDSVKINFISGPVDGNKLRFGQTTLKIAHSVIIIPLHLKLFQLSEYFIH